MQVGCYSLHLYCDYPNANKGGIYATGNQHQYNEFPHELTGETGPQCRQEARRMGWLLGGHGGKDFCPKCVRAGRHKEKANG